MGAMRYVARPAHPRWLVVDLARQAHQDGWGAGSDVSKQTKRSIAICRTWQKSVLETFPERFKQEHCLNEVGSGQKIDLVDLTDSTAYELKASPK